eukprot:251152-Chlamydomonas_euryale.AAC.5
MCMNVSAASMQQRRTSGRMRLKMSGRDASACRSDPWREMLRSHGDGRFGRVQLGGHVCVTSWLQS